MKTLFPLILKEIRVKQYLKNTLVFLPIVFSLNLFNIELLYRNVIMFVSFCLGSSAIYVLNDIVDKAKDSCHPIKSLRPIASGKISIKFGYIIILACILPSFGLIVFLPPLCFAALISFVALNTIYSFYLKNIPLADVSCIALGFIIRVVSGSSATGIPTSNWLLLTILSLSFFLGFGKRKAEIILANKNTRHVLKYYSEEFLTHCMYSMMSVSIVFYSLWAMDAAGTHNSPWLIYTTIPVIIGLFRYALITGTNGEGDPTDIIYKDRALHFIILIYIISVLSIIYLV